MVTSTAAFVLRPVRTRPGSPVPWRAGLLGGVLGLLAVLYLCGVPGIPALGAGPGAQYRVDLDVYRLGAQALLAGTPLYGPAFPVTGIGDPLPFVYPPVAAALFVPLAVVPMPVAVAVLTGLGAVLALWVLARSRQVVAGRAQPRWLLGAAVLLLVSDPVRMTLLLGQVNVLLLALVVADTVSRDAHVPRRWRGVATGIAAAVKLTPLVVVVWFLVRGDRRAAAVATGTFALLTGAGFALAPAASVEYWTAQLFRLDPLLAPHSAWNQGLRGVLARAVAPEAAPLWWWLPLAAAALLVALIAARRCARAGEPLLGLTALLTGGLLASPLSWSHHWVWVLPGVVALLHAGRRPGLRALRWVGVAGVVLAVVGPHGLTAGLDGQPVAWAWWQQVVAATFPAWGVAVLVVLARVPADDQHRPGAAAPRSVARHVAASGGASRGARSLRGGGARGEVRALPPSAEEEPGEVRALRPSAGEKRGDR